MGSTQSIFLKLYDKRSEKEVLLKDSELHKLKKILIDMTEKDATSISFEQLKNYLLPFMTIELIERLYEAMQWKHEKKGRQSKRKITRNIISPIAFVYVIANIIKGNSVQKASIIRFMVGNRNLGFVTCLDLFGLLKDLLTNHLQAVSKQEMLMEFATDSDDTATERLTVFLLHGLLDPMDSGVNKFTTLTQYDDEAVASWLETNPIVLYMFHQLMYPPFPIYQCNWQFQSFLPQFVTPDSDDVIDIHKTTILDIPSIIFLNINIPKLSNNPHEWMLVCSSLDDDELTYQDIISCCTRYDNTLFIIEDSDRYRFGGFSSEKWFVYPKFRGSSGCFVFSLVPSMSLYSSTEINKNWIYVNDHPNDEGPHCLGFGGSVSFFGFSIQPDCSTGFSYPTLTYNSPQLSSKTNFRVCKFEMWAVFRSNAMRVQGWTNSRRQSRQF